MLGFGAATALAAGGSDAGGNDASSAGVWFAVSDAVPDGEDQLSRVDPGKPGGTNEVVVGRTETINVEAMAVQPGTGILFAVDAGRLGIIDPVTGRFSPKDTGVGSGSGAEGKLRFSDVDGLTFDPATGELYGAQRREDDPDLLIRIDPASGGHIPDAFGADADYVVIEPMGELEDVGDIAFSGGVLYAVANVYGQGGDRLVIVDNSTGNTTDVGPLGTDDVQGLCVAPDGSLHASTGQGSDEGAGVWDVDRGSGAATNHRSLDASDDYESLTCGAPDSAGPATARAPAPGGSVSPPSPPVAQPPAAAPRQTPGVAPRRAPGAAPGQAPGTPAEVQGITVVPELPRTGPGDTAMLVAGLALALGGLGVMCGQRRSGASAAERP